MAKNKAESETPSGDQESAGESPVANNKIRQTQRRSGVMCLPGNHYLVADAPDDVNLQTAFDAAKEQYKAGQYLHSFIFPPGVNVRVV